MKKHETMKKLMTYDEIVKTKHQQAVEDMALLVNNKMQECMNARAKCDLKISTLKTAFESAGHPDIDSKLNEDILDEMIAAIAEVKCIDEKVKSLSRARQILGLDDNKTLIGG